MVHEIWFPRSVDHASSALSRDMLTPDLHGGRPGPLRVEVPPLEGMPGHDRALRERVLRPSALVRHHHRANQHRAYPGVHRLLPGDVRERPAGRPDGDHTAHDRSPWNHTHRHLLRLHVAQRKCRKCVVCILRNIILQVRDVRNMI